MSIQMTPPAGLIVGYGASGKAFPVNATGVASVDPDSVSTLLVAGWKLAAPALPQVGQMAAAYILAQSAVPVILCPAGTFNASGQLTLGTALPYVPGGVVQVYLFAGNGLAAGLYPATFSSTTVCQLIGYPATAAGSYAGGTTPAILESFNYPGGSMGPNGQLRLNFDASYPNNANTKTIAHALGGTSFNTASRTTTTRDSYTIRLKNLGLQNYNTAVAPSESTAAAVSSVAQLAIDTSQNQQYTLTATLSSATDYMILVSLSAEIMPGA